MAIKQFNIRIDEGLIAFIKDEAKKQRRSAEAYVEVLLFEHRNSIINNSKQSKKKVS